MIKLINNEFKKNFIREQIVPIMLLVISIFLIFILNDFNKYVLKTIYYIIPFIGIIISFTACSIITSEYKNGTFKIYLTKPVKRWKIFVKKI